MRWKFLLFKLRNKLNWNSLTEFNWRHTCQNIFTLNRDNFSHFLHELILFYFLRDFGFRKFKPGCDGDGRNPDSVPFWLSTTTRQWGHGVTYRGITEHEDELIDVILAKRPVPAGRLGDQLHPLGGWAWQHKTQQHNVLIKIVTKCDDLNHTLGYQVKICHFDQLFISFFWAVS